MTVQEDKLHYKQQRWGS